MRLLWNLIVGLFGCTHANYTFPQTVKRNGVTQTTVSCLNCGKTMHYDFENMTLGAEETAAPIAKKIVPPCRTAPRIFHATTDEEVAALMRSFAAKR